jgi:hypothetical protein
MNLSELIVDCREDSDDVNAPYLVSDDAFTRYLNEGVDQACRRAFLIYDEETPEICEITLANGVQSYPLHTSILRVENCRREADNIPLARLSGSIQFLDDPPTSWRDAAGTPTAWTVRRRDLYVYPTPTEVSTLLLDVFRLPTSYAGPDDEFGDPTTIDERLVNESDEPAIPDHYHPLLRHWALYRAYSRRDAELRSDKGAAEHLALFEAAFGRLPSAKAATILAEQSGRMTARATPLGGARTFRRRWFF